MVKVTNDADTAVAQTKFWHALFTAVCGCARAIVKQEVETVKKVEHVASKNQ